MSDKLIRLAEQLARLCARLEQAGPGVETAAADLLRASFGDLQATVAALVDRSARLAIDDPARAELTALEDALRRLATLASVASTDTTAPISLEDRREARKILAGTAGLTKRLRLALAAGALSLPLLAQPAAALTSCAGVNAVTCTADIPDGVSYGPPVTSLTITAPDDDITPASGVKGVELSGNGGQDAVGANIQADVDTGPFAIRTTGDNAHGLDIHSRGGNGGGGGTSYGVDVTGGHGAPGKAGGDVTVDFDGEIVTAGKNAVGISGSTSGGRGGGGGNAYGGGATGGNAAQGGDGGELVINASGVITTGGEAAHGILGVAAGGDGGDGGDASGVDADGGPGATGGKGGQVTITNAAGITTTGKDAQGIFGRSLGGAGGHGGNGSGIVGGGGAGSLTTNGDLVVINNSGTIETHGQAAVGVFGQSVGGFGGSGGSGSGLVAFGGDGATAGAGGDVSVTNSGAVHTRGASAHGVFGQSIGGGGGAGGSGTGLAGLGSTGAAGGSGGDVYGENSGSIETEGVSAAGLFVQSVGGGGGDGGSGSGLVGIGGGGSGTSGGGTATALNTGSIVTRGHDSNGMFVQSIGGGGGNGGAGGGLISIGGTGGGGGDGDLVTADNSGSIETFGERSTALMAQSIGGGGGNGGSATSAGPFASVSIGGRGGDGGDGGDVFVNLATTAASAASSLKTHNVGSEGLRAQSIGGGGGNGGYAFAASAGIYASAAVALGGAGGSAGDGGVVEARHNGTIVTTGADANGLFAQSIGGGGGNGGFAISVAASDGVALNASVGGKGGGGGKGDNVTVLTWADVDTTGDRSNGLMAQSIGGGGGNGGFAVGVSAGGVFAGGVSLGGDAGDGGGAGGVVTLKNIGNVRTRGIQASGLVAQSIGGGGGTGGFAVQGSFTTGSAALALSLGGKGGAGGAAGDVILESTGTVETGGEEAYALVAQSIGGGGGTGGFSGSLAASTGGGALGLSMGGSGGLGGDAGTVTVTAGGALITHDDLATGILAQSLGGGGGAGGFSLSVAGATQAGLSASFGGKGGVGGVGKAVTVDYTGSIFTEGALAYGVLAQSIGGGGGAGGFSLSGALSTNSTAISVSLGGEGGTGNIAGLVDVNLEGSIRTKGAGSHAVVAQSIGGGGGAGGFSGALSLNLGGSTTVGVSLGGDGGIGGAGGEVFVTTVAGGQIVTEGEGASGIYAQSVGGGGGDGGFSFAAGLGTAESGTNLQASLGGTGGIGGIADAVTVDNRFNIFTFGRKAMGIFAQSLGGGGGSGGFSATGAISTGPGSKQASISVGGNGGTGGHGDHVIVGNAGQIVTTGDESDGIFAQSTGGGGGDGGLAFAGSIGGPDAKQITVAIGGKGGVGGNGGEVDVTNSGLIDTDGVQSNGIYAQSVGGGGGRGGLSIGAALSAAGEGTNVNMNLTIGGSGGAGGIGGAVDVINSGRIVTRDLGSSGVYAQSVGGGGGSGGAAFTGIVGLAGNKPDSKSRTVNVSLTVGGGGGTGNNGGAVTITNSGRIDTYGVDSYGVFAQSVGGGGGVGGQANAVSMIIGQKCTLPPVPPATKPGGCGDSDPASNNINLTAVVGGSGGGASDGGVVTVVNNGIIVTRSDGSDGIFAESVGGGGGIGGMGALGLDGYVPIPVTLLLAPVDKVKKYKNISLAVGGSGGSSGDGQLVTVTNTASIVTQGNDSNGIFAHSIGGGGGRGGAASVGLTGTLAIGSSGGSSGNGGVVMVTNSGRIETLGAGSTGIFAQSVGGGGGVAGNVRRGLPDGVPLVDVGVSNIGLNLALGGNGGGGGDGGAVTVTNTGDIVTHGTGSNAIFAQSVGGGGGLLGDLGNDLPILSLTNFAGSVGDAGSAGIVTVTQTGNIATTGIGSHGIFAQSAGGQGTGGAVNVTVRGDILIAGGNSNAILAQSTGLGGAGAITIDVRSGVVQGGAGSAGIRVLDGVGNSITNRGTVTSLAGIDGLAILSGQAAESVDNHGILIGSLNLGAGTDTLRNRATGEIRSGSSIILGAGELFTNDGLLSPGGLGRVLTTSLTGDFTQSATGDFFVDLDLSRTGLGGEADRLDVSGAAIVGGTVVTRSLNKGYILPGDHAVTILTGAGVNHGGLTLDAPVSAVARFDLRYPNANTVQLGYKVDFSPDNEGLTDNQTSVGDYINAIQTAGSSPAFRPVAEMLFDIAATAALVEVYDRMTPEPYIHRATANAMASQRFTDQLFSCAAPGGEVRVEADEFCGWMRLEGRSLDSDRTKTSLAFDEEAYGMSLGMEAGAGDGWRVGLALGVESSAVEFGDYARSEGDRYQAGVVLKKDAGWADLALAVTGGTGKFDAQRNVIPGAGGLTAYGRQEMSFVTLSLRGSKTVDYGSWYLKPGVELSGTRVDMDAFAERGAGPLNLSVAASDQSYWRIRPSVEIGTSFQSGDVWIKPTMKIGFTHLLDGDSSTLSAGFEGAPVGVSPFTVRTTTDKTMAEAVVGVEVTGRQGASARFGYYGQVGDTTRQQGVQLKVILPF